MSVEIVLNSPLANALNTAIQSKIAELGWAAGSEGTAMSEYFVLMLANGKSQDEIASEIATDLLGLGPEDETPHNFARWLFEQINAINAELNSGVAQTASGDDSSMDTMRDESMEGSFETGMETDANALNAPTGPKAMRNGNGAIRGGREKRMMGQINRALDRTAGPDVLHRVRGQSGIGRGPPNGPRMGVGRQPRPGNVRANNIAAGLVNMGGMPGIGPMNGGPMNGMPPMNQMGGPMNGAGYMSPDILAMMEQQNRMLQQMQQQLIMQQQNQNGHGRGKSLFDRASRPNQFQRGGRYQQHNGHGPHQQSPETAQGEATAQGDDVEMGGNKREAPSPDETICRFNLRCQNKDCKFAHQSPAAPPGTTVDIKDVCTFGAACKNRKCVGRHPSPATKMAHQGEQDCKFFPNCANPHCPFRHPTMPACRNGGECKIPNCKFTHVKTACKFRPCTNRACPFMHEEGQRGAFHDKVWTADGPKEHVSERKFVDENAGEETVLPGSGEEEHHMEAAASPELVV
ncbi:hypothetical protein QBC43DRAFT_207992 [Cladorrhinum sp. PSN259]|nr:hypothetical protein QBC43DRAFT_207992 [Cladorrhinum sp. PSN259]